jgi:hypothetical protein
MARTAAALDATVLALAGAFLRNAAVAPEKTRSCSGIAERVTKFRLGRSVAVCLHEALCTSVPRRLSIC